MTVGKNKQKWNDHKKNWNFKHWCDILISRSHFWYHEPSSVENESTSQPTFQCRINVVSTLWINVEITLIRHWKWNKIRRRIFNVAQPWYNVSARRWNNVETTLHNDETTLHNVRTTLIQRCFSLASTLFKTVLNPFGLVMIMDLQIHE